MPDIHLPPTLPQVFADLPRSIELDVATVADAIASLDARWPGLRDRLCEPGADPPALRPHVRAFVDGERADLGTALEAGSRVDVIAAISGG